MVCGAGMLGVTAVAMCAEAGAEVVVLDVDPRRTACAGRFGAVADNGGPVDVASTSPGRREAIASLVPRLDIGGRVVLAGSVAPAAAVPVDPEAIVRGWLTISGVHNYEPRHLHEAVAFLTRTVAVHPWAELVDAPVPLAALGEVLHRGRGLRAAVVP